MITMDINIIKSMSWSHKDNYPPQNEPFEKAHTHSGEVFCSYPCDFWKQRIVGNVIFKLKCHVVPV